MLAAVLVPMAFFGGSTGVIYRQFSITLVSAMALSVFVALTLTPALCASILRADDIGAAHGNGLLARFERGFGNLSVRYQAIVRRLLPYENRGMLVYLGLLGLLALMYVTLPTAFLPEEDQGALFALIQLPAGATLERTVEVQRQLEEQIRSDHDSVEAVLSVAGRNFNGNGQNAGMTFVRLRDWSERRAADKAAPMVAKRAMGAAGAIRDASIFVQGPPIIRGLGTSSGFDLQLKDTGGVGREVLTSARDQLLELAAQDKRLARVRINSLADQTEFHLEVDRAKASALGLSIADVNDTLSSAVGGIYVNDFIDRGRVKKVYIQSDAPYRMQPADIGNWFVRNSGGEMVPMSAFASGSWTTSTRSLERYNGASSIEIVGEPAERVSSGTALQAMEQLMAKLPNGIGYEWSGLSFHEKLSGSQAPALYAISVLFVFLCLAALYESWSLPFSVMLIVPLGVISVLPRPGAADCQTKCISRSVAHRPSACRRRTPSLISRIRQDHCMKAGRTWVSAVLQAVRIRLRPILMTSLSFMLGVMPLVLSRGAGAAGRIAIGTGVFGGMLAATVFGVFFVPLFFLFVQRHLARPRVA